MDNPSGNGKVNNDSLSAAAAAASVGGAGGQYDPATLLSLYSMTAAYGGLGRGIGGMASSGQQSQEPSPKPAKRAKKTSSTESSSSTSLSGGGYGGLDALAAAAAGSQAASMTQANAWWAMAQQLAAQDYLSRLQSAARDPAAYAALAAQGVLPNYEMLSHGTKGRGKSAKTSTSSSHISVPSAPASSGMIDQLKLPSDTEIIKYSSSTSSSTGQSKRGRKKTISADEPSVSISATSSTSSLIPPGLTIERKTKDKASLGTKSIVDKVEITRVPITSSSQSNGSSSRSSNIADFYPATSEASKASSTDSPLNLSTKSGKPDGPLFSGKSGADPNIPSEYYATQALSGVFLAEQIRQQQLAAALESRLDSQSFNAMQTALLMNKLKTGAALAETSKLLAAAVASSNSVGSSEKPKGRGRGRGSRGSKGSSSSPYQQPSDKTSKNTVASMLAKSREQVDGRLSHPELTIEPIYSSPSADNDQFDSSDSGRRYNTVIEDGKLKIKTVSDSPEIRNLSDHDQSHQDDFESDEHDGITAAVAALLQMNNKSVQGSLTNNLKSNPLSTTGDCAGDILPTTPDPTVKTNTGTATTSSRSTSGKYATVETDELRLPIKLGWRRETTVREYSKSGVRGDVSYYAPCGKKFKQYPDIVRFLEKTGKNKELQRDHFSFSTKIFIGEFLKPTGMSENGEEKYITLNEDEMIEDVDKIRKENGWKPRVKPTGKPALNPKVQSKDVVTLTVNEVPKPNNFLSENEKLMQRIQAEVLREEQKQALRIIRENEKYEQAKLERELKQQQLFEAKRRKQEEMQKQKQEEQIRRLQERDAKRQQAALIKEQERERRRQHMILMRQLEGKKRNDDRERKKEELRHEKEREKDRRIEHRRLELEIMNEMRKPIEDMSLNTHKDLPELERIPGMSLSGEAFANVLMVHEFLNNFGETLGFDMESLPTLDSLHAGLLNDVDSEEEVLSVIIHLVVCAIEDPGIPNPQKHLTILGQNLRQADITNTNVSEILKLYFFARAQAEVRMLHGLAPPDMHYKDRRSDGPGIPIERIDEYNTYLFKTRPYQMSQWVKNKTFLCLNATEKSEMIAYLCNDLLSNKSVVHQIDSNVDNIVKARRQKWDAELKVKKYKTIQARRVREAMVPETMEKKDETVPSTPATESENVSEVASLAGEDKDDSMSVVSESTNDTSMGASVKKKGGRPKKKGKGRGQKRKAEDDEEEDDHHDEHTALTTPAPAEELDEDEKLTNEELQKKIDKASRQLVKRRDELTFATNCMRANDLGQDRYRRRYWMLAHTKGVFVEGLESAEPWKIETAGLPHATHDDRLPVVKKVKIGEDLKVCKETRAEEKIEMKEEEVEKVVKPKAEIKEEIGKEENPPNEEDKKRLETEEALKKLGADILITPKVQEEEVKKEIPGITRQIMPKITPNGDKLNMFNHSTYFNMSLSPVILNGTVTITPKDQSNMALHGMSQRYFAEKPWFSILPVDDPINFNPKAAQLKLHEKFASPHLSQGMRPYPSATSTPQFHLLEQKLAEAKKKNVCSQRDEIPDKYTNGWWRLQHSSEVDKIEAGLNSRGIREHYLLASIRRNVEILQDAAKKPLPDDMKEFMVPDGIDTSLFSHGAAPRHVPGSWSVEVALRVDKFILEQVEALEDKVAAASMQVPGWKLPQRPDIETRKFRPSCVSKSAENDKIYGKDATNPVEEAKERLLGLEANIERRYLKAPLGSSNADVSLQTITSSITRTSANSAKAASFEAHKEEEEKKNGEENGEESEQEEAEDSTPEKEVLPKGLVIWRDGLKNAETAAQVAMAFYMLETSIAWHKSIMKAYCQLCHCGDNEDSLLLCDGCDKGYHMYCFKPPLEEVPDGDWYCYECINKATGVKHCLVCGKQTNKNLINCSSCPRAYHTDCLSPALAKVPRGKWNCPGCDLKGPKKAKGKRKPPTHILQQPPDIEDSSTNNSITSMDKVDRSNSVGKEDDKNESEDDKEVSFKQETRGRPRKDGSSTGKKKKFSKIDRDLTICTTLISEMEAHEESGPFMYPVNTKQFPTYKKVVKQPMDITTIKKKINGGYKSREEFCDDVRLIFSNCELFNEDDSPVGKAGYIMRNLFETRWAELTES